MAPRGRQSREALLAVSSATPAIAGNRPRSPARETALLSNEAQRAQASVHRRKHSLAHSQPNPNPSSPPPNYRVEAGDVLAHVLASGSAKLGADSRGSVRGRRGSPSSGDERSAQQSKRSANGRLLSPDPPPTTRHQCPDKREWGLHCSVSPSFPRS